MRGRERVSDSVESKEMRRERARAKGNEEDLERLVDDEEAMREGGMKEGRHRKGRESKRKKGGKE